MLRVDEKFQSNQEALKWVSWMSFLWATSSLMVFSILPAFLVDELSMGHSKIGLIEGLAISSSFLSKFFSGFLSDVFKKRKPLIMVGTILSAITKPMFALCTGAGMMFGIRFTDRLSKGIRSAPTDALIADLSESSLYGANFGLRQAYYTMGDVTGAVIAMVIMLASDNNYRLVFALSFIPATLAILILWLKVVPNPLTHPRTATKFNFKEMRLTDLKEFSPTFWWLMTAFFFLMLARFSEAFLTLKAKDVGWSVAYLPALIIIKDLVHATLSWPAGKYADKISRTQMLHLGMLLMIGAQGIMAFAESISGVFLGIILVGLHMGTTQGLLKALIAQATPADLRGTAFSIFFIISGFAIFLGNTIAGSLSQNYGLYATYLGGAGFTLISMLILYRAFFKAAKPEAHEGI
jgi:MFS family permease